MKRKLFIGSSSEGLGIATQVKEIISKACGDWLECVIWNDGKVFSYNKSFLESLLNASRRYDYGILIATTDDWAVIRKIFLKIPKDNVVFEMGLFLGSLGLKRAFLFADKDSKLPSDYNGISIPKFSSKKIKPNELEGLIRQLNSTKDSYALKAVPSAALALGYFDNFILPFAKKQDSIDFSLKVLLPTNSLEDINSLIIKYKINYPSDEISVFDDGARPIINRLKSNELEYWDIPTTLSTLNKLINHVIPSEEIGVTPEKKEWVEYEIRNFKGTLEVLIADSQFCKGKIVVDIL